MVGRGCEGFESEGNQPVADEIEKGELVLECNGSTWWPKQRARQVIFAAAFWIVINRAGLSLSRPEKRLSL